MHFIILKQYLTHGTILLVINPLKITINIRVKYITAQYTLSAPVIKINQWLQYKEIITVFFLKSI